MDKRFTEKLGRWLETKPEERDWEQGALLLLQLSGNKIMYRNIMANIDKRHALIEYQLQKYYNFRVKDLTHEQVSEMAEKVEKIVEENLSLAVEADMSHKGKREDHDSLPEDIKKLYVENNKMLQKMRELHLQLRKLSLANAPCPDSERYPFLEEIIKLDKKRRANWLKYDSYAI